MKFTARRQQWSCRRTYKHWNALEVYDKEYCKESSVKTAPGAITTIPLQDFTIRK